VRIVVADDSVLLREGLVRILTEDGIDAVGAVGDAQTLLACVEETRPDLAIIDVRMPPSFTDEGISAAQHIRDRFPDVRVLLLSQHVQPGGALHLFQTDSAGLGYLLKDRVLEIDEFISAVRRVGNGGTAVDPIVIRALLRGAPDDPLAVLSDRANVRSLPSWPKAYPTPHSPSASSSAPAPSKHTSTTSSPNSGYSPQPTNTAASAPSSPTSDDTDPGSTI